MEREFNCQYNNAVECKKDDVEAPKGKSIDFIAKISFAMHILEIAIACLTEGRPPSEICLQEEINLHTLNNAADYNKHIVEVKDSIANVSKNPFYLYF